MNRPLLTARSKKHNAQRRLFSTLHHKNRSEEDVQFVITYLASELLFFQQLPEDAQRAIALNSIVQHVRPGQQVIKNEDNATALYLVWSGSGTVFRRGIEDPDQHITDKSTELDRRHRRMYGNETLNVFKGDCFGEEGLLKRLDSYSGDINGHELIPAGDASITVVAHHLTGMCTFVIDFLLFTNYIFPHRDTLCFTPSHCIDILSKDSKKRTNADLEKVRRFVARIPFFQQLSLENQLELCRVMKQEKHSRNDNNNINSNNNNNDSDNNDSSCINNSGNNGNSIYHHNNRILFQEGWVGQNFYVIVSGVVSVHQKLIKGGGREKEEEGEIKGNEKVQNREEKNETEENSTDVQQRFIKHESLYGPAVAELRHGDSFGEKALHGEGRLRNATIICQSENVLLMVVDRESYNLIIKSKSKSHFSPRLLLLFQSLLS
jgi:CRP-like cAMP-binding protein